MKKQKTPDPLVLIALAFVLLIVFCLCVGSVRLPTPNVTSDGGDNLGSGYRAGTHPPSGGSCANVGVFFEDNPFIGWPTTRFVGDWKVISSWYCDPTYFVGFTHWGIDLAARVTPLEWQSIDHAELISTTDLAVVAAAANDNGANFGMGNHVILKDVLCELRCGSADETPLENHWLFVEQTNSPQCPIPPEPTPTPRPGEPTPTPDPFAPTPTPAFGSMILDCTESGWKATYMHLFDINVQYGMLIERGTVIGWIDNTGNSTGPHLHYQINGPGVGAIDPAPAMCEGYFNGLLDTWRWERPVCPDYAP